MTLNNIPNGATVRTDADGEYIHFHRRCKDCEAELTSRNRSQGALVCKPCVALRVKEKISSLSTAGMPRTKKPPINPEQKGIHSLLTAFLARPTIKELKDELLDALVTHELKERFRTL